MRPFLILLSVASGILLAGAGCERADASRNQGDEPDGSRGTGDPGASIDIGRDAGSEDLIDAGNSDAAVSESTPICDGSDAVRLGMWVHIDLVENQFLNQYGSSFAFVDGHCHYYAFENATSGIARGQLMSPQAQQLMSDIGWSMLEELSNYSDGMSCMDGSHATLTDGSHRIECDCRCDGDAPSGFAAALSASSTWVRMLVDMGTPLDGAVRVVAIEVSAMAVPPGALQEWPLSSDLAEMVSASVPTPSGEQAGVLVDDSTNAAALRQLRTNAGGLSERASPPVYVHSGSVVAQLYIRDELPEEAKSAIEVFSAGAP